MGRLIGPIDDAWPFEEELSDDAVPHHFSEDPEYVAAYLAERDMPYRAAEASSEEEASALAEEALAMMLGRRRWWSQDEGLALILVVDRLLPEWPGEAFGDAGVGALEILEKAVGAPVTPGSEKLEDFRC